ncbi:MAG: phosphatidate cytidylyltransferase [Planctomycetota bacterium]|nr:phosphatidate cytidylyltransferase [Planctomycetota bacterium]
MSGGTKAARIWKRTWVGGGLSAFAAGCLWLSFAEWGGTLVLVISAVITLLVLREVASMGRFAGRAMWVVPLVSGATAAALTARAAGPDAFALDPFALYARVGAVALPTAFAWRLATRGRNEWADAWRSVALALWIIPALPSLHWVRADFGAAGLVALIVLSKVGDVAGYYVGNAIGRTHPFSRISPGKTTAGCVGSFVAGAAAGAACVAVGLLPAEPWGWAGGLLAGGTVNLVSQAGDLLESAVKRWAGVKDSGTVLGPAGGLLDLVDSLLLSVPAAALVWPLLFSVA